MIIKNASIYTEDHTFVNGNAVVENGRFVSFSDFSEQDAQIVDAQGLYMIPGLVDIHFHGCMGADMCDGTKEALDIITRYEASIGVTSVCPATMTIAKDELLNVMKNAGDYAYNGGAHLVGINMEGPFISASKKGAQAEENILHCDYEYFCRLQKAAKGLIKLVDLAPEEPGAMEFIEKAKDEVVISLAHTASDYDTAKEAIQRGASHATHLYNAMPPLNHRNPGVIGAVRDSETCHAELICDGVHIHPSVIRATFAMFGAKRMILISDSMRATGLNDGDYTLGGQPVKVKGNLATLHDGTIAGSATNLMDCVRFVVKKVGLPFETAVMCASENPAKEIGIFHEVGSISAGKKADFVLLDKDLNIVSVYVDEVPDSTFADKILGDGFAVIPSEGKVYAPADGEVSMVFDTLHAVTMTSTQGTEILIHIGLDTVTLKGEPFTPHVVAGDKVKQGDLLMEVDLDKIQAAGLNTITPVLICNTDTYGKIALQKKGEVTLEDAVLKLS